MTSVTLPVGVGLLHLPTGFALEHGGVLDAGQLAFELDGPDDAPDMRAVMRDTPTERQTAILVAG